MRILVDIDPTQIAALDTLAQRRKRPRAVLIRQAISDYVARHAAEDAADAFGLWGDRAVDGQAYQDKVRGEW